MPLIDIEKVSQYKEFAKQLRKRQTETEEILWFRLRNRRLDNIKFRRQFSLGPYITDFFCVDCLLAIEIDGSGHLNYSQYKYDKERTKYLESLGITVIRYWNSEISTRLEEVLDDIVNKVHQLRCPSPGSSSRPLPTGEEETQIPSPRGEG